MTLAENRILAMLSQELSFASKLKREAEQSRNEQEIMYAHGYYDGLYKFMQKNIQ